MRIKKLTTYITALIMIGSCLILTGCPPRISQKEVRNGDFFRRQLEEKIIDLYGTHFSREDTPTVTVRYLSNGSEKLASFQLDAYDSLRRMGYILVTNEDKQQWEEERAAGNQEAPDLNDIALIQEQALNDEYPVLFVWIPEYQEGPDALDSLYDEIAAFTDSETVKIWAEEGSYDGEWMKDSIEQFCRDPRPYSQYTIDFAQEDLPTVTVEYDKDQSAVFQLDGFDAEKRVGYKFVTAADEAEWNDRRSNGDMTAPDLSQIKSLKTALLKYEYPIIFIYQPVYWKIKFSYIRDHVLQSMLVLNDQN